MLSCHLGSNHDNRAVWIQNIPEALALKRLLNRLSGRFDLYFLSTVSVDLISFNIHLIY